MMTMLALVLLAVAVGVGALGADAARRRQRLACPTCGAPPAALRLAGVRDRAPLGPLVVIAECDVCGAIAEVSGRRTYPADPVAPRSADAAR